jgi:hypothetical protein
MIPEAYIAAVKWMEMALHAFPGFVRVKLGWPTAPVSATAFSTGRMLLL